MEEMADCPKSPNPGSLPSQRACKKMVQMRMPAFTSWPAGETPWEGNLSVLLSFVAWKANLGRFATAGT